VGVVGAGVMGCATARAVARAGHEVVLYEQFEFGHDRGSSHGRTRIVRLAYPEREWVRLAAEAFAGWHELEAESGTTLLHLHGLLEFAATPRLGSSAALAASGAPFEPLTADALAARWPVRLPHGWSALFQPQAGTVRADLAVRAFLDGALRHGARLVEGARIGSTDEVDADVVVVTAGSWVRSFADLPVGTTVETVAYFRRAGTPLPSLVQLDPDVPGAAMYSLWDPVHGLKVGAHHAGTPFDPLDPSRDQDGPDAALVERIAAWVAATHPDTDPIPVATQTCRYTSTSDERFVLRRDGRVVIGSACSGHGFKFAPAVAGLLADLVTAGSGTTLSV
jgi:sarcosine oxidase